MKQLVEVIRFLLAGGAGALVNIVARYLLDFIMPFDAATVIAYLMGMPVAFYLMRQTVFDSTGRRAYQEFVRFAIVNAVSFCIVVGLSALLFHIVLPALHVEWHAAEIAHVAGVVTAAVNSYAGHKYFSFVRHKGEEA